MSSLAGFRVEASRSPLYQRRTAAEILAVTQEKALAALQKDAVARRILAKGIRVQDGEKVGSRLNINVLKSTGVAVNTIHRGKNGNGYKQNRGWWDGEVVSYQPVVTLRNAYLNVSQSAREKIASGAGAKEPMASVDGEYVASDAPSFDGVELRFNPKRDHLFRDIHGCAVRCAGEVTLWVIPCLFAERSNTTAKKTSRHVPGTARQNAGCTYPRPTLRPYPTVEGSRWPASRLN